MELEILEKIGLNKVEAKIYQTMKGNGWYTIEDILPKMQISKSELQFQLNELLNKRLIICRIGDEIKFHVLDLIMQIDFYNSNNQFKNTLVQCMIEGQKIDLTGCSYGAWKGSYLSNPFNYHYFLAGFVKYLQLTTIVEIGSRFCCATMAMSRGINETDPENSKIVTIDIREEEVNELKNYSNITRLIGDSLDQTIIDKVENSFNEPIDLLFIDSVHDYENTKKNIEIYGSQLNPKYVILDDIHLNSSMEKLWEELVNKFKQKSFDATKISLRGDAGFGVIEWRD